MLHPLLAVPLDVLNGLLIHEKLVISSMVGLAWGPVRVYSLGQAGTTQSSPSDGLGNWLWDCSWEENFDLHLWNSFYSSLDLRGMDVKHQKNKMQLFLVHRVWQISFWPFSGFVKIWESLPQSQAIRKELFFLFPFGLLWLWGMKQPCCMQQNKYWEPVVFIFLQWNDWLMWKGRGWWYEEYIYFLLLVLKRLTLLCLFSDWIFPTAPWGLLHWAH